MCVRTFRVSELQTTKSKLFNDDVDARKYAACIYRRKKRRAAVQGEKTKESLLRQVALQCERRKGRGWIGLWLMASYRLPYSRSSSSSLSLSSVRPKLSSFSSKVASLISKRAFSASRPEDEAPALPRATEFSK